MAVVAAISKDLEFSVPTVTPKVYITKGPSGWAETFKRTALDKELADFLKPLDVATVVDLFILKRDTDEKKEATSWTTIVGHIARTMDIPHHQVPHTVGIAFWAQIVIATIGHGVN